ncbi:hypothetical protein PBY51_021087 [Eleginops maclovinus]|uniref:Uncharacterized protein n=1 Tax=Eleginops maclovinus TaxID=56733 RepID=A0AAN7XCI7_ELEMC|nr:hypothetical protein PBY51_021087 [Eleginops maclovinus]
MLTPCVHVLQPKSNFFITPESGSEVLCLLSRSGFARFLRPGGADHRVCALTDGELHTDDPLSTFHRKAQPLSPEADPFFQGETLGDGSKGRRNDLEWRSRELVRQEDRLLSRRASPS